MADYLADPPTRANVQAAMNSATSPGDRVVLGAGTEAWTSGVSWSAPAGAVLIGAGTSATGGGDQTVIQDNYNANAQIITINMSGAFRFTGITIQSGTATAEKQNGTILFQGASTALQIDHCHFLATSYPANVKIINIGSGVYGVMYECILDLFWTNAVYFVNGRGTQGNDEWTRPTNFGGADYFFIEDCVINGIADGNNYGSRTIDGWTASKAVVRFNTLYQACVVETHGTGHSGDDRGWRSIEVYGNRATTSAAALASPQGPNFSAVHISGGTALGWGNSWNQVYKNIYLLAVTRRNNATYTQNATPSGWGYAGTEFNGTGSNWDGGTFNGTDTIKGYPVIDMPGRAAGDLLTGSFPNKVNNTTGTIRWPNQALEPVYFWNNTGTNVSGWSGNVDANNTGGRAVSNRDYYLPASGIQTSKGVPFNGTSGVGWGLLEYMPDTCTAGVAYFATDQGSWNQSATNPYGVQQNGASGILYVATATDTWTEYYVPYTYPHPLRAAAGSILNVTTMNVGTLNGPT
jgi:hypothetical protein